MEQNTSNAIYNLMQKLVDKLDNISEKISENKNKELSHIITKNNSELIDLINKTMRNQSNLKKTSLDIEKRIIDSIKIKKTVPSTNNYTEYSVFGKETSYKPKFVLLTLLSLVIVWSTIKYVPSYLMQRSSLKKEKKEFQFFYNYVYLNQFKNLENTTADKFLKRIQQKDTILINEFNSLYDAYQKEIRKQQLKKELKSLDKNDR